MNYSLFYKMIKEAQDSPGKNPTSAVSPAPPKVVASKPSPGISSQAAPPSDTNAPAVPMKETLTADQLAGKWITDKQNFYRGKTNKYPQYADWTMSESNQNKLREQAQKMLDADRDAAWDAYNNRNDYSGSDGFRFATTQRYESLPSVQARRQAEEAQIAQQQPMRNPTASAAIDNTVMPIGSGENGFNQILNGGERAYYEHWYPYPDLNSSQYSEEYRTWLAHNNALKAALRPLFSESIPDRNLTQEWFKFPQAADRGRIGANDLPMMQELYSKALNSTNQYPEIKQFFTGEDGAQLNILQAAQKAGAMQARGEQPPTALEPYWQYLLSVNSRFPA